MLAVLYVLLGFLLVVLGGKYLVVGSVDLANRFRISTMVVGLTVVAFGTSAPELWVSLHANLQGHPDITVGNVLGSNIANIALVLALVAIVNPIKIVSPTLLRDWIIMFLFSAVAVALLFNDSLCRLNSGFLLLGLFLFVYFSIRKSKKLCAVKEVVPPTLSLFKAISFIVLSCVALSYGADFLVKGASGIARFFGIDEKTISITLVAFGTSIPELTVSLAAAFKKEMEITVGNIVGSNIFNIGAVFGITGVVSPITITGFFEKYALDYSIMLLVSVLLILFLLPLYKVTLTRVKGGILFSIYLVYVCILYLV